jgi:predicted dithiol-disulfide oxidoreductase (DUF899 family)
MQTKMQPIRTTQHPVVSQNEWLAARKELLAEEKDLTRRRDALSAKRRELPWVKVEQNYIFDAPQGKVALSDLFRDKSQLIVYHFMLGPGWKEGCPSCSFLADFFDGMQLHLDARDIAFSTISRAPMPEIAAFQQRMQWHFPWVSSNQNNFNFDYHVSFTKDEIAAGPVEYNYQKQPFPSEEAPGLSVFFKNEAGEIFHTYSAYGRGLDILLGAYNYIDMTPKGRDEESLAWPMAWVRHHDRYESNYRPANAVANQSASFINPEPKSGTCCHDQHS